MRLIGLISLLFAMFAAPSQGAANRLSDPQGVRVERVSQDSLSVFPGDVITLVFRSTTDRTDTLRVQPRLDLPDGWRTVRPLEDMRIAPGSPTVRFVSVRIPDNTRAGIYGASFVLADPATAEDLAHAPVTISVGAVHGLRIDARPEASFVAAGKAVDVTISATNEGNSRIDVLWKTDAPKSGHFDMSTRKSRIEPGETVSFNGVFTSDADIRITTSAAIRILARIDGVSDSETSQTALLDVIPSFERIQPRGNPIPLGLTLEASGNEERARPAARVRSSVDVAGGTLQVQATLAGSERQSVYSARNDIRVSYDTETVSVTAGDHPQNLSPLTVRNETGFGVSAEKRGETWTSKASAVRNRHDRPDEVRVGMSVARRVSRTSTLSSNLLVRNGYYSGGVGSFRFEHRPENGRRSLDVECGLTGMSAFADPSCTGTATWRNDATSIRTQATRMAADYPGAAAAATSLSENISYRLGPHLRLDESIQWQQRSYADGVGRTDLQVRAGGSLAFRIGGGSLFSTVHGIFESNRYASGNSLQESGSTYGRLTLGYQLSRIGFTASNESGVRTLTGQEASPMRRTRAQLRVQPLKRMSVAFTAENSLDAVMATGQEQRYRQWGVHSTLALPRDLHMSAGVFRNVVESRLTQEYESVSGRIVKKFRQGSELTFQVQANRAMGRTTVRSADYRLAYTAPLLIPGRRQPDATGLLNGRIFVKHTDAPLAGVLVRYGDQIAITDEEGRFLVAPNPGGESFLFVNPTTLPAGMVTEMPIPLTVDETGFIDIAVVPAAGLRGTVHHFRPDAQRTGMMASRDTSLIRAEGIHSVVLELSRPGASFRTRTNAHGEFAFDGIPAGSYTLRVARTGAMDADFRMETPERSVQLVAGTMSTESFRAIPVRKRIRFLKPAGGDVLSTGEAATPSPVSVPVHVEPPQIPAERQNEPSPTTPTTSARASTSWTDLLAASVPTRDAQTRGAQTRGSRMSGPWTAPSVPRGRPPSPLIGLLFALSGLFLLLDLDLVAQLLLRRRQRNAGILGSLQEGRLLWNIRQVVIYAVLVVGMTMLFGLRAGISTSMGLFAVTLAIEQWDSILCLRAFAMVTMPRRREPSAVHLYHGMPVSNLKPGLFETTVELLDGSIRVVPTSSLTGPAFAVHVGVQWFEHSLVVRRSTNLYQVRCDIESMVPALSDASIVIRYDDLDHIRTRVSVRAVVPSDASLLTVQQDIDAAVPTMRTTSLRLVSCTTRAA